MKEVIGLQEILGFLIQSLDLHGDFPVDGNVVHAAHQLLNQKDAAPERAVSLILQEPALAVRVLHLSNSERHHRDFPVLTITQAAAELGVEALENVLTGVPQRQGFREAASGNSVFRVRLQQSVVTRLMASSLMENWGFGDKERSQIASILLTVGPVALSYYFPQVYEAGIERAKAQNQSLTKSIQETLGIDPIGISIGVNHTLNIPEFYREALSGAYQVYPSNANLTVDTYLHPLSRALAAAAWCTDLLFGEVRNQDPEQVLFEIERKLEVDPAQLKGLLIQMPERYSEYCHTANLALGPLTTDPEAEFGSLSRVSTVTQLFEEASGNPQLTYFLREIEVAAQQAHSITNAATAAMEALAFALTFDRVVLFLPGEGDTPLKKTLALGKSCGDDVEESANLMPGVGEAENPAMKALTSGKIQVDGEALLDDGWPFAALPIGGAGRTRGVIYADRCKNKASENGTLSSEVEHALDILARALDRAVVTRGL